jgi:two-component system cell cycle sensor histidine kinase/response regulator CckA
VRLLFPVAGEGAAEAAVGGAWPAGEGAHAGPNVRAAREGVRGRTPDANGSPAAVPKPREVAGGGIGVLYAEDNAPLRRAGRRVLESGGFVVFEAEDGQRALELFEQHEAEIEFVLSDLVMPEMGGAELYRRLSERRGDLRFILTSGHVDQALDMRDHLPNHVPYILKPWSPDELLETVGRVLSDDLYTDGE